MKSIDHQPSPTRLEHALGNPLLAADIPTVHKFNTSVSGLEIPLRKVKASIPKATEHALELVKTVWDRLEAAPVPGIHLEVGAGAEGASDTMFMREYFGIGFYSSEAPFVSVDGVAEPVESGSDYMNDVIQEGIQESFAELNAEMERQGRSDAIQYRIGSGNDLAAAGIEAESVAELYVANLFLACSLSNQEMYRMLEEFHRVMQPGAHLVIQENSGQLLSALRKGRADDLHPTKSRG